MLPYMVCKDYLKKRHGEEKSVFFSMHDFNVKRLFGEGLKD